MPKTVDNYVILKQLFKDSFQSINASNKVQYFISEHKILKKPFTIKKIEKAIQNCTSKQSQKYNLKLSFAYSSIQNQIQILRELKSQKIIKCLKILKAKNAIYAVYDEHPERTLEKILATQYLTSQKKQTILNQIINLIKQLHDNNIALGNLCPFNLFFTPELKLSLSNFLIAKILGDSQQAHVDQYFLDNTSQYYAPELLKRGTLTKSADIFSLGKIIKNLKFQKSDQDLLSPIKFTFQNTKDLVESMVDSNPKQRPSIIQVEKKLRLNRSRNKSTCGSSESREYEQKLVETKGLQSYKSEATIKFFNQKPQSKTLVYNDSKKTLLGKREKSNEESQGKSSPKGFHLKSRATLELDLHLQNSRTFNFQATVVKKSKEMNTSRNSKMEYSQINRFESITTGKKKQVGKQISLLRNVVSFLIEMILFVNGQNGSKTLCYLLAQQALVFTKKLLGIMQSLSKEENLSSKKLHDAIDECQKQKRKIIQIALFYSDEPEAKKSYETELIEQLRKFGRISLQAYSFDFSTQKSLSQVSQSSYKSKYSNPKESIKSKENQQKLFKTFMLLKRLQYGTYFEFFKAKVHHQNKKFWSQHYFEFERTFGSKYFAVQIKDLIAKK